MRTTCWRMRMSRGSARSNRSTGRTHIPLLQVNSFTVPACNSILRNRSPTPRCRLCATSISTRLTAGQRRAGKSRCLLWSFLWLLMVPRLIQKRTSRLEKIRVYNPNILEVYLQRRRICPKRFRCICRRERARKNSRREEVSRSISVSLTFCCDSLIFTTALAGIGRTVSGALYKSMFSHFRPNSLECQRDS